MPAWLLPAVAGACVTAVIVMVAFWHIGRALCRAIADAISRSV